MVMIVVHLNVLAVCACSRCFLVLFMFYQLIDGFLVCVCGNVRIQEQLRRIKRNEQKEKLQPVKKKKEKPPNNVSGTDYS